MRKQTKRIIVTILLGITIAGAAMGCRHNVDDQERIAKIREAMHPLSVSDNDQYPYLIVDYFKYYAQTKGFFRKPFHSKSLRK